MVSSTSGHFFIIIFLTYINSRHGNNTSDWFILKFVLPYMSPGCAMIRNPVTLTYGKHQPSPSCHFLPLYFLCHDGELMAMSILQCPCPLERSPQVIKGFACRPEVDFETIGKPTGYGSQMWTEVLPVFVLELHKEGKAQW